jgi:hypothetical protein
VHAVYERAKPLSPNSLVKLNGAVVPMTIVYQERSATLEQIKASIIFDERTQ